MTKKIFTLILALCVTLFVGALCVSAEEVASGTCGNEGDNLTWILDDKGTLTISGTGKMTDWSSYLNVSWYSYQSSIKSVVIEEGITCIGEYALSYCMSLTHVEIPASITSIGDQAFFNCTSLASVKIPESVTSIGYSAFNNCKSLSSIEIPASVTSIGKYAFSHCQSLISITVDDDNTEYSSDNRGVLYDKNKTAIIQYPAGNSAASYDIPNSVTRIYYSAFRDCINLTSVEIPSSVTSIGDYAFSHCQSLASIKIPASVTSMGVTVFYYCTNLTSVEISSSVTSIGDYAFSHCYSLANIEIPENVTSIGDSAFADCKSLTSIEIPVNVTSIGNSAFIDSRSLEKVTIYSKNVSFGSYVFRSCPASLTIYGYTGSSAETYAEENNILFKEIRVTPSNIAIAVQAIFGKTLTEEEFKYANVYDADNVINIKDLIKLAQIIAQNK